MGTFSAHFVPVTVKRQEYALSLVCSVPALARLLLFLRNNYGEVRHWQIWVFFFAGLFGIVVGGAIANFQRLRSLRAVRS